MKKLILTGALLLTLGVVSFANVHTISTECGYFTGTTQECHEFLDICFGD